jgi:NhaC family Na+:H+ antiporter
VAKKFPPIPAMLVGCALGVVAAVLFQNDLIVKMAGGDSSAKAIYKVVINTLVSGFSIESGNSVIDSLLSRGGMKGMLSTVWLIIFALFFGGMMEATGMLQAIAQSIVRWVKGTASLVASTISTSIFLNLTVADQYLSIVVTARMFKETYKEYGLKPKNLSRAVEDGATVTSVLVPWNSGGAYFASILGVPTLAYLPYCFFNLLSPIASIAIAKSGYTMEKIGENDED